MEAVWFKSGKTKYIDDGAFIGAVLLELSPHWKPPCGNREDYRKGDIADVIERSWNEYHELIRFISIDFSYDTSHTVRMAHPRDHMLVELRDILSSRKYEKYFTKDLLVHFNANPIYLDFGYNALSSFVLAIPTWIRIDLAYPRVDACVFKTRLMALFKDEVVRMKRTLVHGRVEHKLETIFQ